MNRIRTVSGALALALASLVAFAGVADAELPATFDEAKAEAAESGKPLLVDFFADWCGPCKAFTAASKESDALKTSLADNVVLFKIDAEKGDGIPLARQYEVSGFPTFVLMNAEGETVDRWVGYGGPEWMIEKIDGGVSDLTTLRDKRRAFRTEPTAEMAVKLARIEAATDDYGDAIALYRRAEALDADATYAADILEAMSGGARMGLYVNEDIVAQAKLVLADAPEPDALLNTTFVVREIANEDRTYVEDYVPFLEAGLAVVDQASESYASYANRVLPIDHALFVEQNADHAIELKKATYAEGWQEDPSKLNAFAWWCFENSINLGEAEELARKAVELSPDGRSKANVLDTLAEICNLKGDCGEAVELMRRAVAQDPDNEYFQQQLARFEELLAKQS